MKNSLIYIILLVIISISCKKETNDDPGKIQFALGDDLIQGPLKSVEADTITNASSIVISIEDIAGKAIYTDEKVELLNMNGYLISKPLSLNPDNYKLTKFLILNVEGKVLYATPLTGSAKAYLVNKPLPIAFTVTKNTVTKIVPEILSCKNGKPEDFGYTSTSFDLVKTFDFCIGVFTYNNSGKNFEMTNALLTISDGTTKLFEKNVLAATDTITLREDITNYTIEVSKAGFETWTKTISTSELKNYLVIPLEVILKNNDLIAYYPFSGNAKDLGPSQYNGTIYNAVLTSDRHGNANSAYSVNTSNGYIVIPKLGDIIPSNEITVSLWAKAPNSATNYALVLGPWDSSPDCFGISINSSHAGQNTIFWDFGFMQQGGDAPGRLYFRPAPIDNNWHHYVLISSINQQTMKIYKDNTLLCSKTQSLPLNNQLGKDLNVGKYFVGALDDIRIYNRIISPEEITSLFYE